MKKCAFCAEEILDEAVKCRFCGEWIDKRRGSPGLGGREVALILSLVALIVSLGYVIKSFVEEHLGHRHFDLTDPEHAFGLAVAVVAALSTWGSLMWRRRS